MYYTIYAIASNTTHRQLIVHTCTSNPCFYQPSKKRTLSHTHTRTITSRIRIHIRIRTPRTSMSKFASPYHRFRRPRTAYNIFYTLNTLFNHHHRRQQLPLSKRVYIIFCSFLYSIRLFRDASLKCTHLPLSNPFSSFLNIRRHSTVTLHNTVTALTLHRRLRALTFGFFLRSLAVLLERV